MKNRNMAKNNKNLDLQISSGGILTGDEIKTLRIIVTDNQEDEDISCYDKASYNLRLGAKYYKPKLENSSENNDVSELDEYPRCPNRQYSLQGNIGDCNLNNRVLIIKRYTSIVISTLERLNLPNNVVGRFDLKIRWALQGLILQVGTQVAPGYKGRLFGLLHNLSEKEICIPMKIGILDAEFSYINKEVVPLIYDDSYNSLEGFLKSRPPIVGTLEAFLQVIKKEKEEMMNWKNEVGNLKETLHDDLKDYKTETSESIKEFQITLKDNVRDFKEEITGKHQEIRSNIEANKNELIASQNNSRNIILGIAIGLITISLSIGIPLIATKLTFDKDDYPIQQFMEMEKKNLELYNYMDSVINLNKNAIEVLLQNNTNANDTIEILKSKIIKLEKHLQNQDLISKRKSYGK